MACAWFQTRLIISTGEKAFIKGTEMCVQEMEILSNEAPAHTLNNNNVHRRKDVNITGEFIWSWTERSVRNVEKRKRVPTACCFSLIYRLEEHIFLFHRTSKYYDMQNASHSATAANVTSMWITSENPNFSNHEQRYKIEWLKELEIQRENAQADRSLLSSFF